MKWLTNTLNYEYVYAAANTNESIEYYDRGMNKIYKKYLNDLENNNTESKIFTIFLNSESKEYRDNTDNKRIVIDFIAGMTDDFFLEEIEMC